MKVYRTNEEIRLVGKGWEIRRALRGWVKEASSHAAKASAGVPVAPVHPTLREWLNRL
ncbi:Z-ring formation inhibitor MciZ [Paenibacillus thermoaerophilus]|uniref:Z-ring formation inhibitor MciZ n=1 Tax=Paenibacillus thermoaerophilus TaxID=1215385 RepID=A0ABW2V614_9BACL|nr:Z-ring formation inhibitor MciZ [Paenibacillus thermoaerophilus]TMV12005.1 Z-ring formation inhibitor MciZ [Paenibacillus thermoaerophilus]